MPRCDGSSREQRPVQQSAADENRAESTRACGAMQAGTEGLAASAGPTAMNGTLREQRAVRRYPPGPVGRLR
jgi:hypothetical protein